MSHAKRIADYPNESGKRNCISEERIKASELNETRMNQRYRVTHLKNEPTLDIDWKPTKDLLPDRRCRIRFIVALPSWQQANAFAEGEGEYEGEYIPPGMIPIVSGFFSIEEGRMTKRVYVTHWKPIHVAQNETNT